MGARFSARVDAIVAAPDAAAREKVLADIPADLRVEDLGKALLERATRLRDAEKLDLALEIIAAARWLGEQNGWKRTVANSYNGEAIIYGRKGNQPKRRELFEKCLALREEIGEPDGIARSVINVAACDEAEGRYSAALGRLDRAVGILSKLPGSDPVLARVDNNRGVIYDSLGDYRAALDHYERALAVYEKMGDPLLIAQTLINVGAAQRNLGDYARAVVALQRSIDLSSAANARRLRAQTLTDLGTVLADQGNFELSVLRQKEALAVQTELGDLRGQAFTLAYLGRALLAWGEGHEREAEETINRALAVNADRNNPVIDADCLVTLAELALRQNRPADAAQHAARAGEIATRLGESNARAAALTVASAAALAQGDASGAAASAREAASLARGAGTRPALWAADVRLARALRRQGDLAGARAALDEAIRTIESVRRDVAGGDAERARFFEGAVDAYYDLADLLIAQNRPAEALRVAERAKGRALLDVLTGGRAEVAKEMTAAERSKERALLAALGEANARHAVATGPTESAATAEGQKKARLEYEAFLAELYTAHPTLRLKRSGPARPLGDVELAALLPDSRTALVEFAVGEERTAVWVVTRGAGARPSIRVFTLPFGRRALGRQVNAFREALSRRDPTFSADARALYTRLLGPAKAALSGHDRWVVIPDGPLWELPFQALQTKPGTYVLDQAALAYAPSLSVLREMHAERDRRDRAAKANERPALLAVGNPSLASRPTAVMLAQAAAGLRGGAAAAVFAPLPEAETEVKQLARLYGPDRSRVLVARQADEARVRAQAPRSRVLHFATHAVLSDAAPLYSYIALAPSQVASAQSDDGLLEARELMDIDLTADLAVLSACETARGRIGAGEGVIGLSWALFVAGCPTAVVSQWSVDSAATAPLMVAFHQNLVRRPSSAADPLARAESLRRAALDMRRKSGRAHPFYWAGFVLVGDAR
jgi:CHAT domain-containing protein